MIRFIDIRNQGTGNRFAFWDTICSEFIRINGENAWITWGEFYDLLLSEKSSSDFILDYKSLCPPWVFDNEEDDLEKFYDAGE